MPMQELRDFVIAHSNRTACRCGDCIQVNPAPDHLHGPLAEQLANGGRLVIPIGPPGGFQTLWKFVNENGDLKAYNMGGVMFVPFTGEGISSGGP